MIVKTVDALKKEWIEYITEKVEPLTNEEMNSQVLRDYQKNLSLVDINN